MKISTEDFTDETLAFDDTYGDDVFTVFSQSVTQRTELTDVTLVSEDTY